MADTFSDAIVFDLTKSSTVEPALYGISVPDLGELNGFAINVYAVKDYQQFDFSISNGLFRTFPGSIMPKSQFQFPIDCLTDECPLHIQVPSRTS